MPRIKHVAIATMDPEGTARFYKEGLGLREVGKVDSALAEGYYLTDGHINLAILRFRGDDAATTEGAPKYAGVHHIGFEVEDMTSAERQIVGAGAVPRTVPGTATPGDGSRTNFEVKFTGPDGVTVDLSEHGWVGTD